MAQFHECLERDVRILVVDDDGFDCRKLTADLSSMGCEVSVQSRPEAARTTLRQVSMDFAVLNPMLCGESWYRVLHAIGPTLSTVPWVVVTDTPSSSLAVESMKLGARDVLTKPVTAAELLSVCRGSPVVSLAPQPVDLSFARIEWEHMNKVIRLCGGNMSDAARKLGVPRQTLYNKLRKGALRDAHFILELPPLAKRR